MQRTADGAIKGRAWFELSIESTDDVFHQLVTRNLLTHWLDGYEPLKTLSKSFLKRAVFYKKRWNRNPVSPDNLQRPQPKETSRAATQPYILHFSRAHNTALKHVYYNYLAIRRCDNNSLDRASTTQPQLATVLQRPLLEYDMSE